VPEFIARVLALDIVPTAASDAALLCLFTGCRAGEVLSLRWEDIDSEVGSFRLPVNKSGRPVTLPLTIQTREIVERRRAHRDRHPVWVFPSPQKADSHIVDFRGVFERLAADGFGTFSPHDLRRGFAAALDATGCGAYALKRLLNHSQNSDSDVTSGYVNSELSTLRRFAQAANDFLANGGDNQ
jgi:integrase